MLKLRKALRQAAAPDGRLWRKAEVIGGALDVRS
jgi:hypothetical protein